MIEITRIVKIKVLREQQDAISKQLKQNQMPILTDRALIPDVWRCVCEIPVPKTYNDYMRNRCFLFICLYLFAPSVLMGGTMPCGFRNDLREIIGTHSRSAVSNMTKNLMFYYQEYKDFRNYVNESYALVERRLGINQKSNDNERTDVKQQP